MPGTAELPMKAVRELSPASAATIVAHLEDCARRYVDAMEGAGRTVAHISITPEARRALRVHYGDATHLRDTFHGTPYQVHHA